MKVLLIAHNASIQGSGIALVNIAKQLTQNNIQVIVVVPRKYGIYELLSELKGVKCYIIYEIFNEVFPSINGLSNKILFIPQLIRQVIGRPLFKKKLRKIIEIEKPDIIHTNTGTIRIPSELAREFNIPHFWHIRECQKVGCGFRPYGGEKKVSKLFKESNNHCIAITNSVFNYYNLDINKDCVIYDGVFSSDIVSNVKRQQKDNVLIYIGLLSEKKGVKMLLSAVDSIIDKLQNYTLIFAGEDQMNFKDYIKQYKWRDKIKYLGYRKDIYNLIAKAKMLTVTTEFEGFGFVTAEAMLNRTLVIGRNTAGTKEQMDNAFNIIGHDVALRFTTIEDLANRILDVINMQDNVYKDLTEEAFQVVSNLYTTEKNTENIIKYYKSVLNT